MMLWDRESVMGSVKQDHPAPRELSRTYTFYDEFDDETVVRLSSLELESDSKASVSLSTHRYFSGNQAERSKTTDIPVDFYVVDRGMFVDDQLSLRLDDTRITKKCDVSFSDKGKSLLCVSLTPGEFMAIVNADRARGRIGTIEFTFTEQGQNELYRFFQATSGPQFVGPPLPPSAKPKINKPRPSVR